MFSNDFDTAAAGLAIKIAGVKPQCPKCGAVMSAKVQASFMAGGRVKCNDCDFYGNWRFGTILHGSRMNNMQFLALFFKYALPDDAPSMGRMMGLDPGTIREWREKIIRLAQEAQ